MSLTEKLKRLNVAANVIANFTSVFGEAEEVIDERFLKVLQIEELSSAVASLEEDLAILKESNKDADGNYLQVDADIISKIAASKISKAISNKVVLVRSSLRLYEESGKYSEITIFDQLAEKNLRDILQGLAGTKKVGRKLQPLIQTKSLHTATKDLISSITKLDENRYIAFENGLIARGKVFLKPWQSLIDEVDDLAYSVPRYQLEHGSSNGVEKMLKSLEAPYILRHKTTHLANNDEQTAKRIEFMLAINLCDDVQFLQKYSKEFLNIYGNRDAGKTALLEMLSRAADGSKPSKSKARLLWQTSIDNLAGFELAETLKAGWLVVLDDIPDEQISSTLESQLKQITAHAGMSTKTKNVQEQDVKQSVALTVLTSNYALRRSSKDDVLDSRMKVINVTKPADKEDDWLDRSNNPKELAEVIEYLVAMLKLFTEGKFEQIKDSKQMKQALSLVKESDNSLLSFINENGGLEKVVQNKEVGLLKHQYHSYCDENELPKLQRQMNSYLESIGYYREKRAISLEEIIEVRDYYDSADEIKEFEKYDELFKIKERIDSSDKPLDLDKKKFRDKSIKTFWMKNED